METLFAFFFNVDFCTDGIKAMVGKTISPLVPVKAVAPNFACSHCLFHAFMVKTIASFTRMSWMKKSELLILLNLDA